MFSILSILKQGAILYKRRFLPLLITHACLGLPSIFLSAVAGKVFEQIGATLWGVFFMLLFLSIFLVIYAILMGALYALCDQEGKGTLWRQVSLAYAHSWRKKGVLLHSFVKAIKYTLWRFMLFIFPGVIALVRMLFVLVIASVETSENPDEILQRTIKLSDSVKTKLLIILILITMTSLPMAILSAGSLQAPATFFMLSIMGALLEIYWACVIYKSYVTLKSTS